jgi:purine-nucleoside phosphorylase
VFNFCVDYKRKHGYRQLSIRLQQMEAEMMEEVCLELNQRGIDVLTVFDSIIVKEEDAEEAREVFGNAFGGLEPEIEAEERTSRISAQPS